MPGGGPPASTFEEFARWTVPRSGRIVAAGSHLHGGSKGILLSEPDCDNRTLMASRPLYGLPRHPYYNVLPLLHEPGPIATSWITSVSGIRVARGERLRVRGRARTILRPPGPLVHADQQATVDVWRRTYSVRNLSVGLGAQVRWRFRARSGFTT